ncbi:hypothetical protein JZ751_007436 [Albula glossodonta]|uniref:Apolipoprotein E n=1 Tax=Albula glossodonta TaxID=121402 RepID=A0A8T2N370_9TELE|nr:hypothetical protein JZ751_007436 [Albula glossodonta]
MKAVAVILILAVITGCQARAVMKDEPKSKWEDTVDRFWEYVSDLSTKADEAVQGVKSSQLRRELDTLITDTMAELTIYRDDLQTKLGPYAQDTANQMSEDLQLLFNKLQADMIDAKERSTQYVHELKTMMEQNVDDVKNRVSTYTRKLKKRLGKDTEEIRNANVLTHPPLLPLSAPSTVATYLGEVQSRATQNIESVRESLEPYVLQAREKTSEKLGSLTELLMSQTQDLSEKFETQASVIRNRLEQTAQDLRSTLEGQLEDLANWFTPYAAKIRDQLQSVREKIQEAAV